MKKGLIAKEEKALLGQELNSWRIRQGKTQAEVAKAIGMSRWTVIRLERDSEHVSEPVAYKCWAYLVRELRKEALTDSKADQYAIERAVTYSKLKIDKELEPIDPLDWRLQK